MKRPGYDSTWCHIGHHSNLKKQHVQLNGTSKIVVNPLPALPHTHNTSPSAETNVICSKLHTIISQLQNITNHIWEHEKYDDQSQDWKFVAMVIDRLCLILSIIIITIFTVLIFLSSFNVYHVR